MTHVEQQTRFRALLDRNHTRWTGIARAYAEPKERDDLLQEIALQVWKSLGGFGGQSAIDTWAYRVALNTALAWRRSTKNRAKNINIASSKTELLIDATGKDAQATRVFDEFLASLSKTDRAAMLLYMDGLPNAEAAECLGVAEGAYRVRLHRIRKQFEQAYVDREVAQ